MPSESAHITLACHNQAVISYLSKSLEDNSDWIATIAFYKAVHLVEAVFARSPGIRHGHSHEARDQHLKSNRCFSNIYKHYRPLWEASMVARYLADVKTGDSCRTFCDYLTPDQVVRQLLKHRLHQLERSARKFLSEKSCETLDK
jgi:hypothetical protein